MKNAFYTYGEILWDCLPSGRHAGGAPFNVAAHLVQLDAAAAVISAVGQDQLGDELLQVAADKRVDTRFVSRVRIGLPTGTVIATVDAAGNATYELVQPVAWDEIRVSAKVLKAVEAADALVFGSLASRSPYNRDQLQHLLAVRGPLKFFDVNLRPPFVDPELIVALAKKADVIKLNHDEAGLLAAWLRNGEAKPGGALDVAAVEADCAALAAATQTPRICVTMAAAGAALWEEGAFLHVPAPAVTVRDTVGAGDAFMAGLVFGLTHGTDPRTVLTAACRVGAYVASHHGATPLLPPDLRREMIAAFQSGQ